MASTRASISKVSKRPKINIIPPKQLFVDLTQDDTKTPSPKLPNSSPSAPNAPSKTPSTKDTSSSSIDYIPKSPTSSTSPSPNGYLNPSTSPPPRVSPPPPTQDNASMDITLTLSPNTPLDVQFDTPSPSPPIIAHPIPWNFLEAHDLTNYEFGREEFCLVTGLKFGVENSDQYDNDEAPIPFRRRVFSSVLDACLIREPIARLTPDDNEARSEWWLSSRAYFDGVISVAKPIPRHLNCENLYEVPSEFYREFEEQKRAIEAQKGGGEND
ncbi:hypothetical protein Tco_1166160 [Tanacetum coccineum]